MVTLADAIAHQTYSIGDLRLRQPQPFSRYNANDSSVVTSFGLSCTQSTSAIPDPTIPLPSITNITGLPIPTDDRPAGEDCLTINVSKHVLLTHRHQIYNTVTIR